MQAPELLRLGQQPEDTQVRMGQYGSKDSRCCVVLFDMSPETTLILLALLM